MDYNQFNDPDLDEIIDYINNQEDNDSEVSNNYHSVPQKQPTEQPIEQIKKKHLPQIVNYKNYLLLIFIYFIMSQQFIICIYKKMNPITKNKPQITQIDILFYGILISVFYNIGLLFI